jgi:hypothetical protein
MSKEGQQAPEEQLGEAKSPESEESDEWQLKRFRLTDTRPGVIWKLKIGDLDGVQLGEATMPPAEGCYVKAYLSTGEYPDGTLGEVFLRPDKEGSFLRGALDGFALLMSIALQHGVPLEVIARKFINDRFEPSGFTNDKAVPMAMSFFDFMFRKLALRYLDDDALGRLGVEDRSKAAQKQCQEEEDASSEEKASQAWRPTTGLSGEPFNRRKEAVEGGKDASDGAEAGTS